MNRHFGDLKVHHNLIQVENRTTLEIWPPYGMASAPVEEEVVEDEVIDFMQEIIECLNNIV